MSEQMKVGLVLSGGGAKGAYQVGVLKALRELGTRIDVVSGASIGALNGAIFCAAPSLDVGVERLEEVWKKLGESSPLAMKPPSYLLLLLMAGLKMNPVAAAATALASVARVAAQRAGVELPDAATDFSNGVLSDQPLKALLDQYLDTAGLRNGLPFYVSVYESMGGIMDIARVMTSEFGFADTKDSRFFHIQSLPESKQKEILLASAAIPLLFAPRQTEGTILTDGGQGGWQKQQGNTPITPLISAGCKLVIVTHLNDGSLWSRHDFPDQTILEIRPQSPIARDTGFFGDAKDVLGFDSAKIPSWIEQGYRDTKHCVGRVMEASKSRSLLRSSESELAASEKVVEISAAAATEAMARLKI